MIFSRERFQSSQNHVVEMSAAATPAPAGCITCHLCNASISVKSGTFEKLQAHLETSHEIFYGYETLIAIAFLEDHEKEVIVEKVLPRMKLFLDTAKSLNKKYPTGARLDIEKKLCGDEDASEEKEGTDLEEQSQRREVRDDTEAEETEDEDREESEDEDENPSKRSRLNEIDVSASLEISLDESDETLFFPDDLKTPDPGVSSSGVGDKPKDTVECPICHNNFKKKSMNKHRQRCELRERVRQMDLAKQAKLEQEKAKEESRNYVTIEGNDEEDDQGEDTAEDLELSVSASPSFTGGSGTDCGVCGKSFSSKTNLKRHLRTVHRDTSSQIYP